MEDNLMPNAGTFTPFPQADKRQQKITINGRAEVTKAIKSLDAAIAETDSIKAAMKFADDSHIQLEVALHAMKYVSERLESERSKLLTVLDK